jgi:hypothetical protein
LHGIHVGWLKNDSHLPQFDGVSLRHALEGLRDSIEPSLLWLGTTP